MTFDTNLKDREELDISEGSGREVQVDTKSWAEERKLETTVWMTGTQSSAS